MQIENERIPAITFIGAGKMAWQLFQLGQEHAWPIREIYSRNLANAQALQANHPTIQATDSLDFSESNADFFILCVADQAMEAVVAQLQHTSGSQSLDVLKAYFQNVGVFYPFQTMSKEKRVDFSQVPFCLEASKPFVMEQLYQLASPISARIYEINSESRKKLHLAAVFACNFTNHLFALTEQILADVALDFSVLEHLVRETVDKAFEIGPIKAQTGPAVRNDQNVIQAHLTSLQLQNKDAHADIYQLLSESIYQLHQKNKKG